MNEIVNTNSTATLDALRVLEVEVAQLRHSLTHRPGETVADAARDVTEAMRAAATAAQAAHQLLEDLDPAGDFSARITHHNGRLIERYTGGAA